MQEEIKMTLDELHELFLDLPHGAWHIRERYDQGKIIDCFIEGAKENMPYGCEVLGDDYTGFGDIERKLLHCELITTLVNEFLQENARRKADKNILLQE